MVAVVPTAAMRSVSIRSASAIPMGVVAKRLAEVTGAHVTLAEDTVGPSAKA